jgi:sugar fermentation stimulation protein A
MHFTPPLVRAELIQRYKRFLADVRFEDGQLDTAHVANSGRMLGVDTPGSAVWLSPAPPANKLRWRLHYVETPTSWAGVDTSFPNKLVAEALAVDGLPTLSGYSKIRAEVPYGRGSRIDFLLEQDGRPPCFLEVKNCHSARVPGLADFPDCKAARSTKHMHELIEVVAQGARAVVLFVVQRSDCEAFTTAADLDPDFAKALADAARSGVEVYAHACDMSPSHAQLARMVPVRL